MSSLLERKVGAGAAPHRTAPYRTAPDRTAPRTTNREHTNLYFKQ